MHCPYESLLSSLSDKRPSISGSHAAHIEGLSHIMQFSTKHPSGTRSSVCCVSLGVDGFGCSGIISSIMINSR